MISFLFPKCSDVMATVNSLWLSQLFAELGVSSTEPVQERHHFALSHHLSFDCFFGNTFQLASYVSHATESFVHPSVEETLRCLTLLNVHMMRCPGSEDFTQIPCLHLLRPFLSGYNPCYTTQLIARIPGPIASSGRFSDFRSRTIASLQQEPLNPNCERGIPSCST